MKIRQVLVLASALSVTACAAAGVGSRPGSFPEMPAPGPDVRGLQTNAKIEKALYVADPDNTAVQVFQNGTYQHQGQFSATSGPAGLWVDAKSNVYVTSSSGLGMQRLYSMVTEYEHGSYRPLCVYSDGIQDAIGVTTDRNGTVYVADFNFGFHSGGHIDVYPQCVNKLAKQYLVRFGPAGVAVDAEGNVFVAYEKYPFSRQQGHFVEFKAGSDTPKRFKATTGYNGGMVIDHNDNLIAVDQPGKVVDIISPPYRTTRSLVTGLGHPVRVALNKSETLLFVSDILTKSVGVYDYPSGTFVTRVSGNFVIPAGVSDSPNAVF